MPWKPPPHVHWKFLTVHLNACLLLLKPINQLCSSFQDYFLRIHLTFTSSFCPGTRDGRQSELCGAPIDVQGSEHTSIFVAPCWIFSDVFIPSATRQRSPITTSISTPVWSSGGWRGDHRGPFWPVSSVGALVKKKQHHSTFICTFYTVISFLTMLPN